MSGDTLVHLLYGVGLMALLAPLFPYIARQPRGDVMRYALIWVALVGVIALVYMVLTGVQVAPRGREYTL
ncbi:MAG: hypothetical protein GDA50_01565 [Alphaproteobacteria bacterium GM202ARS2]|nr:hypothetical protein [Alphaproteobacteria bacterium GM202ARS2]